MLTKKSPHKGFLQGGILLYGRSDRECPERPFVSSDLRLLFQVLYH